MAALASSPQLLFQRVQELAPPGVLQLYVEWPRCEAALGNQERARLLLREGLRLYPNASSLYHVRAMNWSLLCRCGSF